MGNTYSGFSGYHLDFLNDNRLQNIITIAPVQMLNPIYFIVIKTEINTIRSYPNNSIRNSLAKWVYSGWLYSG